MKLGEVDGELVFDDVTFRYDVDESQLLTEVERHGRMENVRAALSGDDVKHENGKNGKSMQNSPSSA